MDPTTDHREAQHQLAASAKSISTTRSDRSTYTAATVLLGIAVAMIMILARDLDTTLGRVLVYGAFFTLVTGSQEWIDRTTNSTPRHAKRDSSLGLVASMLIALTVALPWLNWSAQTEPPSAAMQLAAAAGVALPCWIAAVVIYRRHPK